ncbi:arsenate reductase (glutaredoxin) [Sphingomonas sp. BAUL-RG-20F-R05-02]|uniref:arsenate reductase (glutaredoxin) n=1 Tax=Sphingomonas sp. BAUL-RG-20F-R05-02 TaxID=2914830 RepID=UPI001F56B8E7|nr:arsenate reductase (glutaredoxin) [Sphingomonas sp. BAUL-RG-20F-R05-02]
MKATIWHNPRCGTSRTALAILEGTPGVEVEVIEYLKTPPSRDKLAALYARAGMTPAEGVRANEATDRGLDVTTMSDDTVLDAMVAEPILIQRPLVETENGVVLARPPEKVRAIL